jgi:transcriptional regulator of heat shock response
LPAPNILPIEDVSTQEFTEKVQSRSDLYKCSKDYRAKTLPFSDALPCTAFKPKHVGKNEKAIQGFNECLQGVDINELFEEFTEASVVKQSVNQQQIFNNCSVTIVYKKD